MNNLFTIKDINKKVYSLHFEHKLFWEIGFLDGTCAVFSRNGALARNGDRIPDSIEDEGTKDHNKMLTAIQDVENRINKKLQWGYTLADSDVASNLQSTPSSLPPENQLNQKRSAESQGFDLSSAKESLFKKLHAVQMSSASTTPAESNCKTIENHERKAKIQLEDPEDFEEHKIISPKHEQQPTVNFNPEERKGAYLEKIECGETLFYKIQVSKNQLLIEEGTLNGDHHLKQPEPKRFCDENKAQERMKFLIKEKEKQGYKNIKKKFVYDFQAQVRCQKTPPVSSMNAQTKNTAFQQKRDNSTSEPKHSFRSRLDTNQEESPQTRLYCSYKPIEWPESKDPTGFILREKLNGVTCVWNGTDKLTSLKGNGYKVPKEFIQGFPPVSLLGVVAAIEPNSCFRVEMNVRSSKFEIWKKMKFVVYDILDTELPFNKRMETIEELFKGINSPFIEICKYKECEGNEHFQREQVIIEEKKEDGLYLNDPNGEDLSGVDAGLYVWKNYTYEEAKVLKYIYDASGDIKSFEVRHLKGNQKTFRIHHGVKTLANVKVPKIGDVIIYKTIGGRSNAPIMPIFVEIKSSDETK